MGIVEESVHEEWAHEPELGPPCPPKTESDLEFGRLRHALAARAMSSAGIARAHTLGFFATRAEIETSLDEVR
ncbi:MAG: hypothetical protein ABI183_23430, partial [Polyangiaceae bacterium]